MKYELAKELYEAGFPQGGSGRWILPPEKVVSRPSDRLYGPSLDELLEALGDQFYSLTKKKQGFEAMSRTEEDIYDLATRDTAEEALAALWLALNKNI